MNRLPEQSGEPPSGQKGFTKHRLRPKHRRRRLQAVAVLPTLCTLGNLIAGFAAIHYAAKDPSIRLLWHDWTPLAYAGLLICVGMVLDAVDGMLARLTRSHSGLGAQLDSLADVVTFGVAPAFMAVRLVSIHLADEGWIIGPEADTVYGKIIWGAAAVYVACAALRLARFSVEIGVGRINVHSLFRGLPSPGAAGAVASLIILHQHLLVTKFGEDVPRVYVQATALGILFIMLLCAFAMVSSIPYVHVANRYLRGRKSFAYIARIVILLALAVWWLQETMAVVFSVYTLSGPVQLFWYRWRHRSPRPAPADQAPQC